LPRDARASTSRPVRRLALGLAALAFSACFPSTKQGWFTGANLRSEGLCFWKNVQWRNNGVLLAPELAVPMAHGLNLRGPGGAWHGAMVTGSLKKAGPFFLFQGTWRGDGVVLDADVDASGEPIFAAYATVAAGRAGILPRGADVVVVEGQAGKVQVMPPDNAMKDFMPSERPVAEVACEALTLYPQDSNPLEWAGFDKNAPVAELVRAAEVAMREAPGGAVVGGFHHGATPLPVRRLSTQGEWTRIAYVTDEKVVWHGWVPSASVREPQPGTSYIFGMGGFRGGMGPDETGWKACAVEQKLYARVADKVVHVGRLLAATPFRPETTDGRYVSVLLRAGWLVPEKGVVFLLEAGASSCGPWIPPPPPLPKTPPATL